MHKKHIHSLVLADCCFGHFVALVGHEIAGLKRAVIASLRTLELIFLSKIISYLSSLRFQIQEMGVGVAYFLTYELFQGSVEVVDVLI